MRSLSLLILILPTLNSTGCKQETIYPDTIGIESDAELKQRYGCIDVFAIQHQGAAYKALVFKLLKASESDSDYRVVFYKRTKASYRRYGAENNLVNFERPTLVAGKAPRIETREKRLGVRFHYNFTADGVELVPSEEPDSSGALRGHSPSPRPE